MEDEAPEGWIVTGYPWYAIDRPEHEKFVAAYRARFDDHPRLARISQDRGCIGALNLGKFLR
jgi:branched-chain amino acid transport system substrate-binding protein